ncbi:MAG: FtsX-like permease family protein, partial [Catalinimonas sp.]
IVGVVRDFHFRSLQEAVAPLTFRVDPKGFAVFTLRLDGRDLPATVAALGAEWRARVPERPFDYFFLDEAFDAQYRAEERFGQLFLLFAGLAIFIACLGLLGLVAYTLQQRTREIGVRKALGATVTNIVVLVARDFTRLVAVASLIALPLAYWAMRRWLEDYAVRVDLSWWLLLLPAVLVLIVAVGTVSVQSLRAALANPVKSLRSE